MKFSDIKRSRKGGTVWTATLSDLQGRADYEMAIRGPAALVKQALAKSEFDVLIDPMLSGEAAQRRVMDLHRKYAGAAKERYLGEGEYAFKKPAAKCSERKSLVISFRRTRGEGTFWSFAAALVVPLGANIFFALPPVASCAASVFPVSGDQDLFLTLNGAFTPVVAMSLRGGTAVDTVAFTAAPPFFFPFVPFFRVNGFRAGLTTFFMAGF